MWLVMDPCAYCLFYVLTAYQTMKFACLFDFLIQNKAQHKQKHEFYGPVSMGDMQQT